MKAKGKSIFFYIILAIILLIVVTKLSSYIENKYPVDKTAVARILYLPTGNYMKLLSFGYPEFMADLLFIWSIQFIGDGAVVDRYDYLNNIYDTITDLNPKLIDAYRIGALIAYYEMGDMKVVTKILDKGVRNNPMNWQMAVDGGFYCSEQKDHEKSKEYFLQAAHIPDSPTWTWRWVAAENYRLGDKKEALNFWKTALETAVTPTEKRICEGHIHDLIIEIAMEKVEDAVAIFSSFYYRYPNSLSELVAKGFLPHIPVDPNGKVFLYDNATGKVSPQTPFSMYRHIK
ncbi:MAG: hypothetical protein A2Y62_07685 [Candidatus Fischerbacteria bacterium RBG_13_37_8]|uniref:Tetratricopeptide repeat protein n=1 Tax=Candidatus Fischerbacteria bacterium RBG_13_37_8 TaxID=1817863 RepID=A0A1F5V926_9BACT|nr:MAG: hypothetical protein A2Y62_07685 [Candidatus Fischerbacteria bacterium RBG_13_37_8]